MIRSASQVEYRYAVFGLIWFVQTAAHYAPPHLTFKPFRGVPSNPQECVSYPPSEIGRCRFRDAVLAL